MMMPMYVLPPHLVNRPAMPFPPPVVYGGAPATEPPNSAAKELPKSILLPFMSTMIQSLYYIPAMRDAVASKPDGDKAVASKPDGDNAVASKSDGDKAVASKPDGDKAVA